MKPSWRFLSGAVATVLMGLVVALAVSPRWRVRCQAA